ncbi:MAG: UDP-glucose/GDP-mannose dehydrogenase family protein, partial [Thermodesulfobacteriota bacterium]|nr:UDP-glucose/GDP-mannose dehydrogenase family protein [Thermodesulfobacteriota bacterium]
QFGTEIRAYDPAAGSEVKKVFKDGIKIGQKSYEVLGGADALIIITEWNEFREPNFSRIKKLMRTPVVFDGRNIYNPFKMREMGFKYFGIGTL